jgi:hypothetical protein
MKHLRTIFSLGTAMMLSACMATAPSNDPIDGKAVVSGPQAAKLFVENCYNSPDGTAVLRNSAFEKLETSSDDKVVAMHKSVLAKFGTVGDRCLMIFRGNKTKAESREDFASALSTHVNGQLTRSDRGTPLSMTTARGKISFTGPDIIISGPTLTHHQDFEIWFLPAE